MRTLVAYPGNTVCFQQAARAFLEHDSLYCFATTFAYTEDSTLARFLGLLPGKFGESVAHNLRRRNISEVPSRYISQQPVWELLRTAAIKAKVSPPMVDRIWDLMSHSFTRRVARRLVPKCEAIYAIEYTALEAFERASEEGVARILELPSLSSRHFQALLRREREAVPELQTPYDKYFESKFDRRQQRRDREIALADVIMTNSSLTARSHIENGADPRKVFTVPLAAPPTIDTIDESLGNRRTPLKIIWAGSFSIRKGAHYFLEAWRALNAAPHATARVYGSVELPDRLLKPNPPGLEFRGSRSQPELFATMERADVLIFPTLSDGFGMVVTEAFSRGLPVITTDQAGAADLVEHEKNGLIIPAGDAGAIKDALQRCLDNREQLFMMRRVALETARRWQWQDYRCAFIDAMATGLHRAGYYPRFSA